MKRGYVASPLKPMTTAPLAIRLPKADATASSDAVVPRNGFSARLSDATFTGRLSPIFRRPSRIFCNIAGVEAPGLAATIEVEDFGIAVAFAGAPAIAIFFAGGARDFFAAAFLAGTFFTATFFAATALAVGAFLAAAGLAVAFFAEPLFAAAAFVGGAAGTREWPCCRTAKPMALACSSTGS